MELTIYSASYRDTGYPPLHPVHGGGFVFDCRSLKNPGRDPILSQLTGQDQPIINYLDNLPESHKFFQATLSLVTNHLDNYLERKFKTMSVSYQCTGGIHRSVYMANRLAQTLRQLYPQITISVQHLNSDNWPNKPVSS